LGSARLHLCIACVGVRVVAFNTAEKWSQDVSVAHELRHGCVISIGLWEQTEKPELSGDE
jgi:hypothetical protein